MSDGFLHYLESQNLPYEQKLLELFNFRNFDKIIKFIKFTRIKHVELCKNGMLDYLLQYEEQNPKIDTLILILISRLVKESINFMNCISKESIINALSLRGDDIISILLKNITDDYVQFTIPTNEISFLKIIAKKNDPYLLESLLLSFYDLMCNCIEECNAGLFLFKFAVDNDLDNIIECFFLFVDIFQLTDDELFHCASLFNEHRAKYNSGLVNNSIPSFAKTCNDILFCQESLEYLNYSQFSQNHTKELDNQNENIGWLIETKELTVCDIIEDCYTLGLFHQNKTNEVSFNDLLDVNDILCELPYFLMLHPEAVINDVDLTESVANLGGAIGKGVFKELFIKYFEQFFNYNIDFKKSDDNSEDEQLYINGGTKGIYILPPMKIDKSNIIKYKTLYYGLGIVYLKMLYSKIPVECKIPFHIWFFKVLFEDKIGDVILKDKDLFMQEAIQFDNENKWLDSQLQQTYLNRSDENAVKPMSSDLIPQFYFNKMFNEQRKDLLNCFKKGFFFEFDPEILPLCLKKTVQKSKANLQPFYGKIKKVRPESIRYILEQNQGFDFAHIRKLFVFKWYYERQVDLNDMRKDRKVKNSTIDTELKQKFQNTEKIILNCFKEWCRSNPEMMSRFLKITIGINSLTPLLIKKWEIAITQDQKPFIYSWTCDNSIGIPLLDSKENFIELINRNYNYLDGHMNDYNH